MLIFQETLHSIVLILSIAFSFSLAKIPFQYDLLFTSAIFIVYIVLKIIINPFFSKSYLTSSIIFTLVILNIINSTGSLNSPLFFLNYFLIFALSLILEPLVSLTSALTLIIFYLGQMPPNQSIKDLLPILSIGFLTPFALFLGEEYQKVLEQKKEIIILKKEIEEIEKLEHQSKPENN